MKKVNCLVLDKKELEDIVKPYLAGAVSISCVCGEPWFNTSRTSDEHHKRWFFNKVGQHLNIKVNRMHCVEKERGFEIWVEYENLESHDNEYTKPIIFNDAYDLVNALQNIKVSTSYALVSGVKIEYNGKLYNVNNLYVENDKIFIRPIELMPKYAKIRDDISYADEDESWSLNELCNELEDCYVNQNISLGIALDIEEESYLGCVLQVKDDVAIIKPIDENSPVEL